MNRTTLPITSIIVDDRQRLDLGDLTDLAESIKDHGLIQPIVVNQNNQLIAGGRRLAAHHLLGRTEVDVVYKETLSELDKQILEAEENLKRKDFTWQEKVLAIEKVHNLRKRDAAMKGEKWGQRETQRLFNINSGGSINYSLRIAQLLRAELDDKGVKVDARFWKCDSLTDAWKLVLRDDEEKLLSELARRHSAEIGALGHSVEPTLPLAGIAGMIGIDDMPQIALEPASAISDCQQKDIARTKYLSNPFNDPNTFEEYYEEKSKLDEKNRLTRNTINLSRRLLKTNCIEFMSNPEHHGLFDHIITDPPYGIDMAMLNQQNPHGQMVDIDTVLEEHEVEPNKELLAQFFPLAFSCLKDKGFCITWCDQMLWDFMYNHATKAGFKVCRWPITWSKLHRCMNQSAQYNFTKSTEIAMVMRKGNAVLADMASTCVINAAHDDYKEKLGHPFVKPFAVWEFLITHVSIEGQLILEPFAGRGSGVISLARLNRNFIACECNDTHYNALLENVKNHYREVSSSFTFI